MRRTASDSGSLLTKTTFSYDRHVVWRDFFLAIPCRVTCTVFRQRPCLGFPIFFSTFISLGN
jgi:hypothetical protein